MKKNAAIHFNSGILFCNKLIKLTSISDHGHKSGALSSRYLQY